MNDKNISWTQIYFLGTSRARFTTKITTTVDYTKLKIVDSYVATKPYVIYSHNWEQMKPSCSPVGKDIAQLHRLSRSILQKMIERYAFATKKGRVHLPWRINTRQELLFTSKGQTKIMNISVQDTYALSLLPLPCFLSCFCLDIYDDTSLIVFPFKAGNDPSRWCWLVVISIFGSDWARTRSAIHWVKQEVFLQCF